MVTLINQSDLAILRPLWGKGDNLRLWAENGLVCWESSKEDCCYGSMHWRDAAVRVLGLSEMVARPTEGGYASERQQIQRFICEMERVIRVAKEQGAPEFSVEATEEYRRSRPKTVCVPQEFNLEI